MFNSKKGLLFLITLLIMMAITVPALAGEYEPPSPGWSDPLRVEGALAVPSGDPGQTIIITIPVYFSDEYGWDNVKDIVLGPTVSTDPAVWPFEINRTSFDQKVVLSQDRARISFNLLISEEAGAGLYPLQFTLSYAANNGLTREVINTPITTYVEVLSDGSEYEDPDDEEDDEDEDDKDNHFTLSNTLAPHINVIADQANRVQLKLPILSSNQPVTNVYIEPVITTDLLTFPFIVEQQSYRQELGDFTANQTKEVIYDFLVSEDAVTGAKGIGFNIGFTFEDKNYTETITAYINVNNEEKEEEDEDEPKHKPKLIISSYSIAPEKVYAGSNFTLSTDFTNTSTETIYNLTISITNSDLENAYVVPAQNGSNTIYIRSLAPGATISRDLELQVRPDTPAKPNMMNIEMDYEDSEATEYNEAQSITVPINQEVRVVVEDPRFDTDFTMVGQSVYATVAIVNMGKSEIYNTMITVEGPGLTLEESMYAGNVGSGTQYNADIGIIPMEAGEIAGEIVISYEDEYGDMLESRLPFSLYVEEMYVDDMGMGDMGMGDMDYGDMDYGDIEYDEMGMPIEGGGVSPAIIGTMALVAITVLIIVIKKKRKKKRLAELAEDDEEEDVA